MRRVLFLFGRLLSYLCPFSFISFISKSFGYIRTGYLTRKMREVGNKVFFYSGVQIKGPECIILGNNVSVGRNSIIATWSRIPGIEPKLFIGNNVGIGADSFIAVANSVTIGDDVLMGAKITVTDNSHGESSLDHLAFPPSFRPIITKGPVIIEEKVWIGDKVTVLPNVRIGARSIIGANSVVVSDIPPDCVAVGNPCTVVRQVKK